MKNISLCVTAAVFRRVACNWELKDFYSYRFVAAEIYIFCLFGMFFLRFLTRISAHLWTIQHYTKYFDINTSTLCILDTSWIRPYSFAAAAIYLFCMFGMFFPKIFNKNFCKTIQHYTEYVYINTLPTLINTTFLAYRTVLRTRQNINMYFFNS